ncbi:MAG: acyl carrier protein [Planctomycetota bacterium]
MAKTISHAELVDKLCEMAADQVGAERTSVTVDTHLVEDLNFDSLDQVDYAMRIEDEFDVSISDEQAQNVKTVGQAVEVLAKHLR